jgi:hypothetical protein
VSLLPGQATGTGFISGMAFDEAGNLYASDETSRHMCSVNTTTGELTILGDTDISLSGIAVGSDGALYGMDYSDTNLYRLDWSTFEETALGDTGALYSRDICAVGGAAATAVAVANTPGGFELIYSTTDPVTPTSTGVWSGTTIDGIAYWPAFGDGPGPEPVPEPISMIFFATGLVGVAGLLGRKRRNAESRAD